MKRTLRYTDGKDGPKVSILQADDMDAVTLHKDSVFVIPVFLYVFGPRDEVYAEKAYAWRDVKFGDIVYLQDDEQRARVVTQAEYETFEVFQDDQNS